MSILVVLFLLAARSCTATQCSVTTDDSQLVTFNGVVSTVHLPCFYRLASLRFPLNTTARTFLGLDVLARNTLTADGSYFVKDVKILVSILTYRPRTKGYKKGPKTSFFISDDHVRQKTSTGAQPWSQGQEVIWHNLTFRFLWDRWTAYATLVPPIPGVEVVYRGYVHETTEDLQPGVRVIVPKNLSESSFNTQPEYCSLCLSPKSGDLYQSTASLQDMKPVSLVPLYFAFRQKSTRWFDKQPLCRKAKRLIKHCINHPALAIKYCGFLLNDRELAKNLMQAEVDPMQQFVLCLRWVCRLKRGKCRQLHRTIPQNSTSPLFKTIHCSKKRLRAANKLQPQ